MTTKLIKNLYEREKKMRRSITILSLMVCICGTNAYAGCGTGDLFGKWHFIGSNRLGEGAVCEVFFNAKGKIVLGASNCERFNEETSARESFDLDPATRLSVNFSCKVTGMLGIDGTSPLPIFEGQMSRDGEYIQGTLNEDPGSELFTLVKIR